MSDRILTLFSSDTTLQYVKDIFSVLSLPRNCILQFRYQAQYIENDVKAILGNVDSCIGTRVLIAFRNSSKSDDENKFIVPIRWAKIVAVKHFSDVYNISLEIFGYPSFTNAFRSKSIDYQQLNQYAKSFLVEDKKDIAVLSSCLDIVDIEDHLDRDIENWRIIVEYLTKIPKYSKFYFLKCSSLYSDKMKSGGCKRKECKIVNGRFCLTEGQLINVDLEFYCSQYNSSEKQMIEVFSDGTSIKQVKGLQPVLQSRYGLVSLGFQTLQVSVSTLSEIIICTSSQPEEDIQTNLVLPVIIKPNKKHRLRHALITSIGAALVALPGILSNNVDFAWNIASGVLGALILGINYFLDLKE